MKIMLTVLLAAAVLAGFTACSSSRPDVETEVLTTVNEETAAEAAAPEATAAEETAEETTAQNTEAAPVSEAASTEAADYKEAYRQFLLTYLKKDDLSDYACFSLIYLDDDDVPELVISDGDFHLSTAHLYAFDGAQVRHIDDVGNYGTFTYESRKSLIYVEDVAQGHFMAAKLEYKNGKLDTLWSGANDEGAVGEEKAVYEINQKTVPAAEFNAEYDRIFSSQNLDQVPSKGESGAYALTRESVTAF